MDILTFLTEQFNSRSLSYRTIGVYMACISQLHDLIEGQQVGNLPLVSRFTKDIFELRTPEPRLCSSLELLASLSLKDLCLKLTILLALTSAAPAHELAALDLTCIVRKEDSWEFTIPIHVKNSRPYIPSRKIFLTRYQGNPEICVVRCLNHYLQWTEQIREGKNLLISYAVIPHNAVGSLTIPRWLLSAIQKAGVELSYKGHSTRAASTSGVADSGLPLELILEAADWSSARKFEKHYHKPTDKGRFAQTCSIKFM